MYLSLRFYKVLGIGVILYLLGVAWESFIWTGNMYVVFVLIIAAWEFLILKRIMKRVTVERFVADQLSMGEWNIIKYHVRNSNSKSIKLQLNDELPFQLQNRRDYLFEFEIKGNAEHNSEFSFRPVTRGNYEFGSISLFGIGSVLGLVEFKKIMIVPLTIKVFPNIVQMRKAELNFMSKARLIDGAYRTKRIGISDEFESIRSYLPGDSVRLVNWKATSRVGKLRVNNYEDKRSQDIYIAIDKGRSMEMPFDGLSLLDHSINAGLALSNIILKKNDNVGLIGFEKEVDTFVKANLKSGQLELILNKLYHQKTSFYEPNFESLYFHVRKKLQKRTVLILFTNFESLADLKRNMKYLKLLNRSHLLILFMFENTALREALNHRTQTKHEVYRKTMIGSLLTEKKLMSNLLNRNGIHTVLTDSTRITLEAINKYLEFKSLNRI